MTNVKRKGRAPTTVSTKNKLILWTRAGGRCQYENCNAPLLGDIISGEEALNSAFVAHIVAASPDFTRGDLVLSYELADDISNLMLLCHTHHRLIDHEGAAEHPVARLTRMKAEHETRIAMVTGIAADRSTHILHYAARIGENDCPVSTALSRTAVLPERYPVEQPLALDLKDCGLDENDPAYWVFHEAHLESQFRTKIGERLRLGTIGHVSTFAIAPQPLLIKLGQLLSDLGDVEVRQISREPRGWTWRPDWPPISFRTRTAAHGPTSDVALSLGVSAHIDDSRIRSVLGDGCPIWSIEAETPGNDVLGCPGCLEAFRTELRRIFAAIRLAHGDAATIHIFPALPVAMAVEVGRVWMPKADLPLVLWDERRDRGGFQRRMTLGEMSPRQVFNVPV